MKRFKSKLQSAQNNLCRIILNLQPQMHLSNEHFWELGLLLGLDKMVTFLQVDDSV